MAWIVTTSQMSSSFGLKLEHCGQETGKSYLGNEIVLHPGVTVNMRAAIPGSFGIRHTPKIAGFGGSTINLVEETFVNEFINTASVNFENKFIRQVLNQTV